MHMCDRAHMELIQQSRRFSSRFERKRPVDGFPTHSWGAPQKRISTSTDILGHTSENSTDSLTLEINTKWNQLKHYTSASIVWFGHETSSVFSPLLSAQTEAPIWTTIHSHTFLQSSSVPRNLHSHNNSACPCALALMSGQEVKVDDKVGLPFANVHIPSRLSWVEAGTAVSWKEARIAEACW